MSDFFTGVPGLWHQNDPDQNYFPEVDFHEKCVACGSPLMIHAKGKHVIRVHCNNKKCKAYQHVLDFYDVVKPKHKHHKRRNKKTAKRRKRCERTNCKNLKKDTAS